MKHIMHSYFAFKVKFYSDTFVCSNCGNRVIKKVYGDTCTCSNCGGTMYRQK